MEDGHHIDRGHGSQQNGARLLPHHWPCASFQAAHRSIGIDADDQLASHSLAVLQQFHMPHVQQVEAPIGEHNTMPSGPPFRCAQQQSVEIKNFLPSRDRHVLRQLGEQFALINGGRSDLPHDDRSRDVGKLHCRLRIETASNPSGYSRDHRISGSRYVEDFPGPRRRMKHSILAQDANALLAHSHDQVLEPIPHHQFLPRRQQSVQLTGRDPGRKRKLAQVGADRGRAPILAEIAGLRVDQHRNTALAPLDNDRLAELGGQGSLGIVGQYDRIHLRHGIDGALHQPAALLLGSRIGVLDIQPHQLLVAAQDARLRDGEPRRNHAGRVHLRLMKKPGQAGLLLVCSPIPGQHRLHSETCQVHGHVGRPARCLGAALVQQNRDRSFRRHALDIRPDIAVEHQVADHQDPEPRESAFKQIQNGLQVSKHRAGLLSVQRATNFQGTGKYF